MGFRLLGLLLFFTWLMGCSDRDKGSNTKSVSGDTPRIKKTTRINAPKSGSSYSIGDLIHFELESEKPIDSIIVECGAQSKAFTALAFDWKPERLRTGNQKIRVKAFFGGESETHYPRITFFSDIKPQWMTCSVQATHPHNPEAYTQGLFFKGDTLIESTGQNGTSWLSKVNPKTGLPFLKSNLDSKYFGEGCAYWGGHYYQLTWTSQIGFIYDQQFKQTGTFHYTHEGWGMAVWGDTLLVSDGTEVIHFLDPHDLSEIDRIEVYAETEPIEMLNELEVIDGNLYANIYPDNEIAVIDLKTGSVLEFIDCSGLLPAGQSLNTDAFNGIAQHPVTKKIYVTGKLWPTLFEVKFTPKS